MAPTELARMQAALTLDLTGSAVPGLIPAAVLAPLFFKDEELHVLFTQRTLTVKVHRGQVSFPGGARHPDDPNLLATALRETREEIGVEPDLVQVLGSLKPIATVTGYSVTTFAGLIPFPYDFRLSPEEVQRLLLLPLAGFYPPERWSSGPYEYEGRTTRVCYWRANHEVIWGATARILLNLLACLGQRPVPGDQDATCLD
jgi:8-oxo-dGTP pyrophosphatase MutT (NUDIX family)